MATPAPRLILGSGSPTRKAILGEMGIRFNVMTADIDERALFAEQQGVEGAWGDRASFMRAHYLVPDTYRQDMIAARARAVALAEQTVNGEI